MKILVSGASGFIGRNLIKFLKRLDCEVITICMFQKDLTSLAMQIEHLENQFDKFNQNFSNKVNKGPHAMNSILRLKAFTEKKACQNSEMKINKVL